MARIAIAFSLAALVGLGLLAGLGQAQLTSLVGPDREALLFDGDLQLDSGGINIVSWGSGTAEPVYEETYVGPRVLKVTSHGPYQGIVLQLANPVDLGEFTASGNGYLDLRVLPGQASLETRRLEEEALRQQARAAAGVRGGALGGGGRGAMRGGGGRGGPGGGGGRGGMRGGGGGRGGVRGGGGRGGMLGGGRGGMRGGGRGGERGLGRAVTAGPRGGLAEGARPASAPGEKVLTVRNLRLVLFTDRGQMIANAVPVGVIPKDDRGWIPVTVPLSQMKGAPGATKVRAVGVFADESDVFYLGRVRLLADSRPVDVTVKAEPLFARPNQLIEFSASLRGGAVDPQISWDFDKADGIQQQALGSEVKFLYKEPGDYLVTCTVTDKAGVRAPATAVVGIRVEGSA